MNHVAAVLVLAALMGIARWGPIQDLIQIEHRATVSLGFILIFGYLVGHFARRLSLPGITGYILAGIFCGPFVARLLTPDVVSELQLIDDLALALIAFTAGGELRLARIRPRLRNLLAITGFQIGVVLVGMTMVVFVLSQFIPVVNVAGVSTLAIAIVFGVFAVASSPATAVAVATEAKAHGPFTETVLGVTVLKDVAVLVLITLLLPFIRILANPEVGFDLGFIDDLAWEVGGSILGGVVIGFLVTLYMKGVGAVIPLFIVGISILVTQAAKQFHLEPLLLCMVAGFVIENTTTMGDRFIDAIERSSLPVYVVFFAISGAALDLGALRTSWILAAILVSARIGLTAASTALGERLSRGGNEAVVRWGGLGFVAQAGVTLGLASVVARKFPEWGPEAKTIALAMIALNQIIGPIGFRWALHRSGEARASRVKVTGAPV
jgi:Kef-type K+ transport system membrane component KefB